MKTVPFNAVAYEKQCLMAIRTSTLRDQEATVFVSGEWCKMRLPDRVIDLVSVYADQDQLYAYVICYSKTGTYSNREELHYFKDIMRVIAINRDQFLSECKNSGISTADFGATADCDEVPYLQELFEYLNVRDRFSKIVLSAIIVNAIIENRLAKNVDRDDLIKAVAGKDVPRYEFDVCYLASDWAADLAHLLCKNIGYGNYNRFYIDVIFPYLRKKSPMEGVELLQ